MIPVNFFGPDMLLSSLVWGAVGAGCVLYGKKQSDAVPLIGGLALVAVSSLIPSALYMSVFSLLLIGGMVAAKKQGF